VSSGDRSFFPGVQRSRFPAGSCGSPRGGIGSVSWPDGGPLPGLSPVCGRPGVTQDLLRIQLCLLSSRGLWHSSPQLPEPGFCLRGKKMLRAWPGAWRSVGLVCVSRIVLTRLLCGRIWTNEWTFLLKPTQSASGGFCTCPLKPSRWPQSLSSEMAVKCHHSPDRTPRSHRARRAGLTPSKHTPWCLPLTHQGTPLGGDGRKPGASGFTFHSLFLVFLGPQPRHMEVPRLGVEWELQLPAYTTAIATLDPSHVCDLHHSSRQCRILNPRSKARDRTRVLMDPSRVRYCCAMMRTPRFIFNPNQEPLGLPLQAWGAWRLGPLGGGESGVEVRLAPRGVRRELGWVAVVALGGSPGTQPVARSLGRQRAHLLQAFARQSPRERKKQSMEAPPGLC